MICPPSELSASTAHSPWSAGAAGTQGLRAIFLSSVRSQYSVASVSYAIVAAVRSVGLHNRKLEARRRPRMRGRWEAFLGHAFDRHSGFRRIRAVTVDLGVLSPPLRWHVAQTHQMYRCVRDLPRSGTVRWSVARDTPSLSAVSTIETAS